MLPTSERMCQVLGSFWLLISLSRMNPQPTEAARTIQLEFVADLSYNPRTHQYRIDLTKPHRSELPRDRNYLVVDVEGFAVEKVLNAIEREVIDYYQQKCDQARQAFEWVRSQVNQQD